MIKKIWEVKSHCKHPEHDPPKMMVFEPGTYEHECPGCGKKIVFRVTQGQM